MTRGKRRQAMRIGALAARTGISRETIHFYLREGLLPRPRKAARNIAFYDHTHLERLLLIKRLQNERFLPLSVIKRLLAGGRVKRGLEDLDLREHIAALADQALPPEELSEREIKRRTGLGAAELARAAELELTSPLERAGQTYYSAEDTRVLELLAQAVREAGYDFELAAQSFALYARHIAALERDEARLVFDRLLAAPRPEALVEALRRGREVQARFLAAARARRLKREIDDYLGQIEHAVAVSGGPSAFPLSDAMLARLGHPERVRRLLAEAQTDAAAAARLVALEYGVGRSAADLSVLAQRLRQRHGERAELVLYQGLALVDAGEFEAGIALLQNASALQPASALAHAALGSAHVRRARRLLLEAGAQAALREVTAGLAALERSQSSRADAPDEALHSSYLRGRVYTSLPHLFETFDRGLAELRRVAAADPRAPGMAPLARSGVLPRLQGNALYFLGVALEAAGQAAEARSALLRAAEIDAEGQLGARARERLQGVET